jgi:hypothetical protein
VSSFAGGYTTTGLFDGIGTNAYIALPQGIAFDSSGNMYFTDFSLHNIRFLDMTSGTSRCSHPKWDVPINVFTLT